MSKKSAGNQKIMKESLVIASSGSRPSGADAFFNRALGMIYITIRSILFDRKTMAVAAILLLLLAIPLIWLNDPPSDLNEDINDPQTNEPNQTNDGDNGPNQINDGDNGPNQINDGNNDPDMTDDDSNDPNQTNDGDNGPNQINDGNNESNATDPNSIDPDSTNSNDTISSAMDMFMGITVMIYLQFIVLYVCFLYGTGLITSEIDDRTMTYLISRPINRMEILVYKYIGYVFSIFTIFAIPLTLNYLLFAQYEGSNAIIDNLDFLLFSLGGVLIGVLTWGALFMLMASVFKNPLMPGFLYCIFFETMLANIGGNISKITVTYYIRGFIINGMEEIRSGVTEGGDLPVHGSYAADVTFLMMVVVSMVFLFMSWLFVKEKDFN